MPFLNDRVFDSGLAILDTEATRIDICSSEPTTYTQANSTLTLGNKTLGAGDIGAPAAGSPNGRQVTVQALTAGSVTATGTATHYAITDTGNSRLLATGALSAPQAVTNGNTFSTSSFTIRIPQAS